MKDLFKKRKANHLVIYLDYGGTDTWLFKLFSKLTYSIGPFKTVDQILNGLNEFKIKHNYKLKSVTINTYGTGKHLINSKELVGDDGYKKQDVLMKTIIGMLDNDGVIQFATCFGGLSHRKLVEISEKYDGINVASMYGEYSLKGDGVRCKCKEKGFSKKTIETMERSRDGFFEDEIKLNNLYRRSEGEEINWISAGMAYKYNNIMIEEGVCVREKQPYTSLECVMNYIFNKQY